MRLSHKRNWSIALLLIVVIGVLTGAPTLVHEEDFSDNQEGWFVDQRMAIRNGRYEFSSSTGAAYAWRTRDIADGSLEVQAIWRGGLDSHGYGMIFRLTDEFNYYFFWIAAQGYYILGKAVDGKAEVFRSWTYEPVIAKRGTNTLHVDLKDSQIIYKINNQEVYRHTDSSFASGGYGFYTQKDVQAAFDNFKAWTEAQPSTDGIVADIVVKEAEPIAIKPLISMIVDEFTPIARERGIRCSLLPTDDNHWSVSVTRDDVETVVMNLISNAVKFTSDGGSIEVSYASSADGGLALSVKDTGMGLDTEEQRLVFNRWYRIHGQTNQYQTGLGLTLVKTIMEQYGGKVEVESTPKEGSTFTLYFPPTVVTRSRPSHDTSIHLPSGLEKLYTSDLCATEVTEEHATALPQERATVLVVDDNRDMCAYIVSVLCDSYRVVCANSGEEGLQRLEEHQVDIIICDIMMPAMDGHQFLAEIRRQYKENPIPLIFLTARDSVGEKIESLESGAVHYITKPFGADVLLATIARTLAHDREIIASKIEQVKKSIDEALEQIIHPGHNKNASSLQRHIERFVVESNLSSREQEVLQLILEGKSDKEIAITLNLSVKTVANHNRSLYRKAQVASRYELIARIYGYDS